MPGRAAAASREAGVVEDRIVEINEAGLVAQAIREGRRVASTDPSLPFLLASVDSESQRNFYPAHFTEWITEQNHPKIPC